MPSTNANSFRSFGDDVFSSLSTTCARTYQKGPSGVDLTTQVKSTRDLPCVRVDSRLFSFLSLPRPPRLESRQIGPLPCVLSTAGPYFAYLAGRRQRRKYSYTPLTLLDTPLLLKSARLRMSRLLLSHVRSIKWRHLLVGGPARQNVYG